MNFFFFFFFNSRITSEVHFDFEYDFQRKFMKFQKIIYLIMINFYFLNNRRLSDDRFPQKKRFLYRFANIAMSKKEYTISASGLKNIVFSSNNDIPISILNSEAVFLFN